MNKLEISWASLWRVVFMIALVIAIYLAGKALLVLFVAIIISAAMDGVVSYLQKKKIPRVVGTIFIFLAVLSVIALILYLIVPVVVFELQNFLENISKVKIPMLGKVNLSGILKTEQYISSVNSFVTMAFSGGTSFLNFATAVFGNLALIATTFVAALYLTINQFGVEKFLRIILPITYEEQAIRIYLQARKKLGYWFQGEIVLMFLVGAMTFFGLWVIGVKYALLIGIVAGLLEILPIIGPIIAGILAFMVALSQSWAVALYSVIVFITVQQLEANILVPLVMKKAVGVSPVIVIISLLAGAEIGGLIGAILAVPITVVLQEIVFDWEKKKMRTGRLQMEDE